MRLGKKEFSSLVGIHIGLFTFAIAAWVILAKMGVLEQFHHFSQSHADWDLDAILLLVINLTLASLTSVMLQAKRMRGLYLQREFERKRAEENARHDPLTGLMNRRAFAQILQETCSKTLQTRPRYVAMIDLDKFKPVNDVQGHAAGDATLREVAKRLKSMMVDHDRLARLGGDEFAILFSEEQSTSGLERRLRQILHAIETPIEFNGIKIHISASIGLAHWTVNLSPSQALAHADKALYNAKNQGKACFAWYDAELDRKSVDRAAIENELRQAVEEENIEAWFQPIVDIDTQIVTGFEVLARWTHPTRGAIPPGVFIEIAEDSGLITSLGYSLLRQACISAQQWDPTLTLSFNISPIQFLDRNLVENIEQILSECNFTPNRLTIEVTESSVISDFDMARKKLDSLKALGTSVALDDFGTGYSSLASLRQLPFDRIKIDRSFVTNIIEQPQNQKIVSGIMALAKGLELNVTAEGIETAEDLAFLQDLDCPLGQGFLFDRAVSGEHVAWLLETKWSEGRVKTAEALAQILADQSKAG